MQHLGAVPHAEDGEENHQDREGGLSARGRLRGGREYPQGAGLLAHESGESGQSTRFGPLRARRVDTAFMDYFANAHKPPLTFPALGERMSGGDGGQDIAEGRDAIRLLAELGGGASSRAR